MIRRLIILLLIVGCDLLKEEDVYGCTLSDACNFNANATIFDDTCEYSSCSFDLLIGTWKISQIIRDVTCQGETTSDTLNADNASNSEEINMLTLNFIFHADSTFELSGVDDWAGNCTTTGEWSIEDEKFQISLLAGICEDDDTWSENEVEDNIAKWDFTVDTNTFSYTWCHNNAVCSPDISGTSCGTYMYVKQ